TLLAYLALEPHVPPDAKEKSPVRDSREKAAAWMGKTTPTETTQARALRLLRDVRAGKPAKEIEAGVDGRPSPHEQDGRVGQDRDLASDAYATGQALYYLSLAGVKNDRTEIQRGVSFLAASQKEDGSWPTTPRGHPGEKPANNTVPITYLGSAWATLGLLRS